MLLPKRNEDLIARGKPVQPMNLSQDVKTQHDDPEALRRGTTRSIEDLVKKTETPVAHYYRNSKPSMRTVTTQ